MRKFLQSLLFAAIGACVAFNAAARQNTGSKDKKEQTMVYIFGVAQDLADTTVYVSSITSVAGATLKSHNELENWMYYSEQFKKHIEASYQRPHQTVAVYYDRKLKNLEKKYEKVEAKIRKKSPYPPTFKYIRPEEFHFKVPLIIQMDDDTDEQ